MKSAKAIEALLLPGLYKAGLENSNQRDRIVEICHAAYLIGLNDQRSCTCHPDDNPPVPCPRKYALNECRAAAPSMKAWEAVATEGARLKREQLYREIGQLKDPTERADLEHTYSKLFMFLEEDLERMVRRVRVSAN